MMCGGDGWCCLGEEVGDFYWRPPLLFGSMLTIVSSCLNFGLLRCLRCYEVCVLRVELFSLFD